MSFGLGCCSPAVDCLEVMATLPKPGIIPSPFFFFFFLQENISGEHCVFLSMLLSCLNTHTRFHLKTTWFPLKPAGLHTGTLCEKDIKCHQKQQVLIIQNGRNRTSVINEVRGGRKKGSVQTACAHQNLSPGQIGGQKASLHPSSRRSSWGECL